MAGFSPIASTPIAAPIISSQGLSFLTEPASAADTQAAVVARVGAIAETLSAADALLEFEILTETATATDTPSCALIRVGDWTAAAGAREDVLNGVIATVASAIAEAATATDTIRLPVWTDRTDDDQTWSTNTPADNTWTNRSHAESTWTNN